MCPNGSYDVALVEWFAPVCRSLRSLGLESRATIQFTNVSERNLRRCVGRWVRTGLQIASLPRLGKPRHSRSVFQTERAKRTMNRLLPVPRCFRTEPSTLRWSNGSHWLTYRFAPSAWKAERLFNSPTCPKEPTTLRWSNRSHRIAYRFAPSAWKAERLLLLSFPS